MTPTAGEKPRIGMIGAGRAGNAMAVALSSRGYTITYVYDRSEPAAERLASRTGCRIASEPGEVARGADVVFITTTDSEIPGVCREIVGSGVELRGKKIVHMSGALSLEALSVAAREGCSVLCIHPLQTFADIEAAVNSLPGSTFGVTCGDPEAPWAEGLVEDLGGRMLRVDDRDKVLYHAAAVVACNLLTMIEHAAQDLYMRIGLTEEEARDAFMPLVRSTVENIGRLGPVEALTGPLARGDRETIRSHLEGLERLDPEFAELYRVVSQWGLKLVAERGEVAEEELEDMRSLFGDGTQDAPG